MRGDLANDVIGPRSSDFSDPHDHVAIANPGAPGGRATDGMVDSNAAGYGAGLVQLDAKPRAKPGLRFGPRAAERSDRTESDDESRARSEPKAESHGI